MGESLKERMRKTTAFPEDPSFLPRSPLVTHNSRSRGSKSLCLSWLLAFTRMYSQHRTYKYIQLITILFRHLNDNFHVYVNKKVEKLERKWSFLPQGYIFSPYFMYMRCYRLLSGKAIGNLKGTLMQILWNLEV